MFLRYNKLEQLKFKNMQEKLEKKRIKNQNINKHIWEHAMFENTNTKILPLELMDASFLVKRKFYN